MNRVRMPSYGQPEPQATWQVREATLYKVRGRYPMHRSHRSAWNDELWQKMHATRYDARKG